MLSPSPSRSLPHNDPHQILPFHSFYPPSSLLRPGWGFTSLLVPHLGLHHLSHSGPHLHQGRPARRTCSHPPWVGPILGGPRHGCYLRIGVVLRRVRRRDLGVDLAVLLRTAGGRGVRYFQFSRWPRQTYPPLTPHLVLASVVGVGLEPPVLPPALRLREV